MSSETQGLSAGDHAGLGLPHAATMDAAELASERAAQPASQNAAAPATTTSGAVAREESSRVSSPSHRPQVLPATPTKQPRASVGRGGGYVGCREVSGLAATTPVSGGGGGGGSKKERDLEDLGLEEVIGDGEENAEQMAAVTRHHLAVVIHAQVFCICSVACLCCH